MTRTSRRALAASALIVAVATLAACQQGADAPDPVSLGLHGVTAVFAPPLANQDLTAEQGLEALGVDPSESATAAMEWLIAGDCSTAPPTTEEFAVACDEYDVVYLLGPAKLTEEDVASASVIEEGGVTVTFTDEAATDLAELTALAAGSPAPMNQVAMVIDGKVVTAPAVQQEITGGAVEIRSADDDRDWDAIAAALNAGAAG